ncbi:DUF1254 domain-containing protein [Ancylobacter sp. A5.8]|uniref:DUF1254 domain-containing protein n=1 Tax=Ancylobacter gelatini TaxID=2919920 RepID=UPI001F4D5B9A|nr:DUF1254 domain-containing protein [Ancylobacter gelatini]MCJ8143803.1 DUF1254 domain-containing protein [Ancylobacter gelatini]
MSTTPSPTTPPHGTSSRFIPRPPTLLKRLADSWLGLRWLIMPVLVALVLGALVHLVTVLILPFYAEQDGYARLAAVGEPNEMVLLDDPSAKSGVLPRMDPAFVTAACVYDLSEGPLKVRAPVTDDYASISFFTRHGVPFYAINDRTAGRDMVELDLMNAKQKAGLPENDEVTAADQLVVESPTDQGIVLVRALVREPGAREQVRTLVETAMCAPSL